MGPLFGPQNAKEKIKMGDIYYLSERNRIVEEHLHCIDTVIGQNWPLIKAARLERDDVYQQLAIRLMRCVETFDPKKGELKQHIYAQLKYELLNCKDPYRTTGITGAPKDFRKGNIISLDAIGKDSGLYNQLVAA